MTISEEDLPIPDTTNPGDTQSGLSVDAGVSGDQEQEAPSEEVTAAAAAAKQAIDDKIRVFLEDIDGASLEALIAARRITLGDAAFAARAAIPDTYESVLVELGDAHSVEGDRSRASIPEDQTLFDTRLVRNGKVILGPLKARRPSGNGAKLSGNDALAAFATRDGWMKRIALYNSGFTIDVTQPVLIALNNFFNKANDDTNTYGRQFGGLFFYFHDLMIKEAIVEMILPLVINSNLRNALRNDTLIRNIKLVDLKMILNALGALMFPDGFKFTHVCSNQAGGCMHHEELLIDINKLARYDFSKMPDACIQHMSQQTDVTPAALAKYHETLGFDGQEIRYGKYGFTMRSPSIADYLNFGRVFNSDLLSNVFVSNPDSVQRAVLFSYYQIYTPFVAKLTLYEDDDTVDVITEDASVIAKMLLRIQSEDTDTKLVAAFDAFIAGTEIGHICYPAAPCPSCNHVPGSGYYTVDPALTFFMQSLTKLSQT